MLVFCSVQSNLALAFWMHIAWNAPTLWIGKTLPAEKENLFLNFPFIFLTRLVFKTLQLFSLDTIHSLNKKSIVNVQKIIFVIDHEKTKKQANLMIWFIQFAVLKLFPTLLSFKDKFKDQNFCLNKIWIPLSK